MRAKTSLQVLKGLHLPENHGYTESLPPAPGQTIYSGQACQIYTKDSGTGPARVFALAGSVVVNYTVVSGLPPYWIYKDSAEPSPAGLTGFSCAGQYVLGIPYFTDGVYTEGTLIVLDAESPGNIKPGADSSDGAVVGQVEGGDSPVDLTGHDSTAPDPQYVRMRTFWSMALPDPAGS